MSENMNLDGNMPEEELENITLFDAEGKAMEFTPVAYIEHNGKNYEILAPAAPIMGMEFEDGDALVFETTDGEDGTSFSLVTDEKIIDEVFVIYDQLWEEEHEE